MNVDPTWMVPKPGRFGQLSPCDDAPARPAKRLKKRRFAIAKIGHGGGLLNMHAPTVGPSRFADVDRALRLCFGHHANLWHSGAAIVAGAAQSQIWHTAAPITRTAPETEANPPCNAS